MYEFTELRFRFVPTAAVTTSPGVVFLAWEPNANRGVPADVKYINAFEYHSEGPVYSNNIELVVNQAHLPPPRYCRHLPTSSDLNLYDTGRLVVATDNCTIANIGYVEVYYTIKFYSYHLEDTLPVQSRMARGTFPVLSGAAAATDHEMVPTFTEDFGGATIDQASGGWILPAGKYLVSALANLFPSGAMANMQLKLLKDGVTALVAKDSAQDISDTTCLTLSDVITSTGVEIFKIIAWASAGSLNTDGVHPGRLLIEAL